jgi:hypothetical protein
VFERLEPTDRERVKPREITFGEVADGQPFLEQRLRFQSRRPRNIHEARAFKRVESSEAFRDIPFGGICGITDFVRKSNVATRGDASGRLPDLVIQFEHSLPDRQILESRRRRHATRHGISGTD